jgi:N-acetylglucosamine-6-sulfatase
VVGIAGVMLLGCGEGRDGRSRDEAQDPLVASSAEEAARRRDAPNVVVIMTDDQREETVRVMDTVERKLKGNGTTFQNFFATFPLCCPSRATFLTGQYAHNHGVTDNQPPNGGYESFDPSGSLPVSMQRAGYRTAHIGKYLNGYGQTTRGHDPREVPPGWSRWFVPVEKTAGLMFDYTLNENGELREYGDKRRHYQTDVYARLAKRFIRRSASQSRPFFLTVATLAPHGEGQFEGTPNPRPAPRHKGALRGERLPKPPSFNEDDLSDKPAFVRERSRAGSERRRQLQEKHRDRLVSLLAVDGLVKRVLGELRKANELRDTVVIFTSDNGYLLGEHRLKEKKRLLYEESVRVPLIMRGPGIPPGEKRDQLVGNIDLAPTIVDYAGATLGRSSDGRSLIPLARDETVGAGRDILLENGESKAVRTPRYLYAEHPNGERELYELDRDPLQLKSRHTGGPNDTVKDAAIEERLAYKLRRLAACAGAACRSDGTNASG